MAEVLTMLALSPTMEEGNLVSWTRAEGDKIKEGEIIAEVETDKARMEMESFFSGTILKLLVPAGSAIPVGTPMAIIGAPGEDISTLLSCTSNRSASAKTTAAPEASPAPAPATPTAVAEEATGDRIFASPVARRMAGDHRLDLKGVAGSGPRGRIVKKDVEAALETEARAVVPAAAAAPTPAAAIAAPAHAASAGGTPVKLTQMRKAIARRMTESWTSAPHFMLTTVVEMDRLMALRAEMNGQLASAGADVKLSVNDFIVKACAVGLREVPGMNVAWGGDHIIQHDEVHIGLAVALDGGLITPVIRHADRLTLGGIARSVRDLATRARELKLTPDEYTGSTFSLSNLGMFGVTSFQAVLNPPEAGILAVGAVVQRPVVRDGAVVVGQEMAITLSCDHRSSDGALGARLLQSIKRLLENPVLLTV